MKNKITSILIIGTAFCIHAFAADTKAQTLDPKQMEMMKAFEKYATPGEAHKTLARMAGKWSYTIKHWEQADSAPQESKGVSTLKMILSGHFLQQDFKGKFMDKAYEGMGITGYDNIKEKYDTIWIDNMGTGVMHGSGTYDSANKTLKDSGSHSCPFSPSKTRDFRSEWNMIDKNNSIFTMWSPGMDQKEFKQMEITYKRIK